MRISAVEIMTVEVEEQIALSRNVTSPVRPEITSLRLVDLAAESLIVAALLGELVLVLANVVARVYFHHSFLWTDEIARLALSILAFIGGAVAYRRRDHAFASSSAGFLRAGNGAASRSPMSSCCSSPG
jgi:hypothetical protein